MSDTPTAAARAARIEGALQAYQTALGETFDTPTESVVNLLTDLHHFCHVNNVDLDDCIYVAQECAAQESEGPSPLPINVQGKLNLLLQPGQQA